MSDRVTDTKIIEVRLRYKPEDFEDLEQPFTCLIEYITAMLEQMVYRSAKNGYPLYVASIAESGVRANGNGQ